MDFVLIGMPYDGSQTFRKGAAKGPEALRKVFPKLETFVSGVDLSQEAFIDDYGDFEREEFSLKGGKFPIILGGDHSITRFTVPAIAASQPHNKPKSVLVFDAHPDCEDSDGHDGFARRLAEMGYNIFIYKPRCMSVVEKNFIESSKNVKVISEKGLKEIEGPVYVSIDYDALDPSLMPAVGNPEPDGLTFKEIVDVIAAVADKTIAVDFVELTPTEKDTELWNSVAGKLVYAVIAEIAKSRKG